MLLGRRESGKDREWPRTCFGDSASQDGTLGLEERFPFATGTEASSPFLNFQGFVAENAMATASAAAEPTIYRCVHCVGSMNRWRGGSA